MVVAVASEHINSKWASESACNLSERTIVPHRKQAEVVLAAKKTAASVAPINLQAKVPKPQIKAA